MKPVVIVGAGYAGALTAANLAARGGPPVVLVERGPSFGRGAAYGTRRPEHLLNVRAANMSAFADQPDHFVHWLGTDDGAEFAPRMVYGAYLERIVASAARGGGLDCLRDTAVTAEPAGGGWRVALASGQRLEASALVLALGNFAPETPRGIDSAGLGDLYHADPWRGAVADGLATDATVLLIGTGLTMIDAALSLDAAGFAGRIVAVSRRGLVPRVHAFPLVPGPPVPMPEGDLARLVRSLRERAAAIGWRPAVDEWRPHVAAIWRAAAPRDRARFLRHLRPWWDVHRHRIAPVVGARIDAMIASGRLEIHAGRFTSVARRGNHARAAWQPRGGTADIAVEAVRVVNCTGPGFSLSRAREPLVDDLLRQGALRPDPLRLGIDTDPGGAVLSGTGPVPGLHAVGPLTRGAAWEIVAVPHIRHQVADLARRLSALG